MSTNKWKKENLKDYRFRVTIASGIPEALEKASQERNLTIPQYIRDAVLDKLFFDGFTPTPKKKKESSQKTE